VGCSQMLQRICQTSLEPNLQKDQVCRRDNAQEFLSLEFKKYCSTQGMVSQDVPEYTPQ
jgi:hypothetical protein